MTAPALATPIFEATEVGKQYGAVAALDGVGLSILPGEVHGLLGENGAGKSTLINICSGLAQPDAGAMRLGGQPYAPHSTWDAAHAGVRLVTQQFDLAPNITVGENLCLGSPDFLRTCRGGRFPWARARAWAQEHLDRLGIPVDARTPVAALSVSARQLVALTRAVLDQPRVIFLDEPSSALDSQGVDILFRLVEGLRDQDVAVVYVSHKLEEVFLLCDRITVLRDGRSVGLRVISETDPEEVIRLMVGRELGDLFPPRGDGPPGQLVLQVTDLFGSGVHGVDLEVRIGEILGIGGLVGAGRTELARAICGLHPITSGEIRVSGRAVAVSDRRSALAHGLEYMTEDRLGDGLVLQRPIAENISMRVLHRFARGPLVSRRAEHRFAIDQMAKFRISALSPAVSVHALSGGNQQKTMLAACLASDPQVIFLDEPTRGIDVGAKAQVYQLVRRLAQDRAVVVISAELIELLGLADRILMMRGGQVVGEFDPVSTTEEELLAAALGVNNQTFAGPDRTAHEQEGENDGTIDD